MEGAGGEKVQGGFEQNIIFTYEMLSKNVLNYYEFSKQMFRFLWPFFSLEKFLLKRTVPGSGGSCLQP